MDWVFKICMKLILVFTVLAVLSLLVLFLKLLTFVRMSVVVQNIPYPISCICNDRSDFQMVLHFRRNKIERYISTEKCDVYSDVTGLSCLPAHCDDCGRNKVVTISV